MPLVDRLFPQNRFKLPVLVVNADPIEGLGGEISGYNIGLDLGQLASQAAGDAVRSGEKAVTEAVQSVLTPTGPGGVPGPATPMQLRKMTAAERARYLATGEIPSRLLPGQTVLVPRATVVPNVALQYGTLTPIARTGYTLAPAQPRSGGGFGPTPNLSPGSSFIPSGQGGFYAPPPQDTSGGGGYYGSPGQTGPRYPGDIEYGPVTSPYEHD